MSLIIIRPSLNISKQKLHRKRKKKKISADAVFLKDTNITKHAAVANAIVARTEKNCRRFTDSDLPALLANRMMKEAVIREISTESSSMEVFRSRKVISIL